MSILSEAKRDATEDLELLSCSLSQDPTSESTKCAFTDETVLGGRVNFALRCQVPRCCKPCNWICALPTWLAAQCEPFLAYIDIHI